MVYSKTPVLIIDNANQLVDTQPQYLEDLQDYAKQAADQGEAIVVFVSNEGQAPELMQSNFTLFAVLLYPATAAAQLSPVRFLPIPVMPTSGEWPRLEIYDGARRFPNLAPFVVLSREHTRGRRAPAAGGQPQPAPNP